MAQAHWKSAALFSALACASHFAWGAGKTPASDEFDGGYGQSYAEIPVESIQQFVQIYGIVKDNYVKEKTDDELFQPKAIWLRSISICVLIRRCSTGLFMA